MQKKRHQIKNIFLKKGKEKCKRECLLIYQMLLKKHMSAASQSPAA